MHVLVDFYWRYGGEQVFLLGPFSNCQVWCDLVPMTSTHPGSKVFHANLKLQHGFYQYNFVVDDRRCFDMELDHEVDGSSNLKNTLTLGKTSCSSLGFYLFVMIINRILLILRYR